MSEPAAATLPLIIDTDAGVDDALALMMALAHPRAQVLAITTVHGNVAVDQVVHNVALVLEQMGREEIPFFPGAARPLVADPLEGGSTEIMGEDGLGGATRAYPAPRLAARSEPAALALVRLAREHPGGFTLVALGPLTNLALALRLDPGFPARVARLVVMGGAVEAHGNTSPVAEFNVLADPEAAAVVFEAGFPQVWLLPWETTLAYPLAWETYTAWVRQDTPRARLLAQIADHTAQVLRDRFHAPGYLLPDPLAMAVALDPDGVQDAPHVALRVETQGRWGRGLTAVDWQGRSGLSPNVHVVRALDPDRAYQWLGRAVEGVREET